MYQKAEWELAVEKEFGEPTETLIPRLLNEKQRMEDVADMCHVAFMTIYRWFERRKGERRFLYVLPEIPEASDVAK